MVTASHNPPDYNGLKFVREQARPVSGDTGLQDIRKLAEAGEFVDAVKRGNVVPFDIQPSWRDHVLSYVDVGKLKPLSIVCNGGNGGAGIALDLLEKQLPFRFTKVHHEPDGELPEWRAEPDARREPRGDRRAHVRLARADIGIAFDGDFDRCFFFDEEGRFIDGYYIVGLLASYVPRAEPRRADRPRSARRVEHAAGRARAWRPAGAVQVRPRIHEAGHARGRRDLRRRDERPSLLPRTSPTATAA